MLHQYYTDKCSKTFPNFHTSKKGKSVGNLSSVVLINPCLHHGIYLLSTDSPEFIHAFSTCFIHAFHPYGYTKVYDV